MNKNAFTTVRLDKGTVALYDFAAGADAEIFKAAVQARYPAYSGGNYLDMTAGFFFP